MYEGGGKTIEVAPRRVPAAGDAGSVQSSRGTGMSMYARRPLPISDPAHLPPTSWRVPFAEPGCDDVPFPTGVLLHKLPMAIAYSRRSAQREAWPPGAWTMLIVFSAAFPRCRHGLRFLAQYGPHGPALVRALALAMRHAAPHLPDKSSELPEHRFQGPGPLPCSLVRRYKPCWWLHWYGSPNIPVARHVLRFHRIMSGWNNIQGSPGPPQQGDAGRSSDVTAGPRPRCTFGIIRSLRGSKASAYRMLPTDDRTAPCRSLVPFPEHVDANQEPDGPGRHHPSVFGRLVAGRPVRV